MVRIEQATQEIYKMIVNHQYDDEHYLPCEGKLSEMLGFSRATIREAVRGLEVRGLVKRIHGKGVMVVDNAIGSLTQTLSDLMSIGGCTLLNLIEVRNIIETGASRLAAERATPADVKEMEEAVQCMENADSMDEAYLHNDLRFHLAMVHAAKNPVLSAIVESYTPLLEDTIQAASQGEEVIEKCFHYHRNVLNAIIEQNEDKATEAMQHHLIATEENVLGNQKVK